MKIKKGDKVKVIAGKSKGTTGVVTRVLVADEKVVVEGANIAKKHQKATRRGSQGQIVEVAMPIHVSNVMYLEGKETTRIGIERTDGKRTRISKKSGKVIK